MRSTAGAVQRYTPEPVTDEGTNRELQRIASAMSAIADGQLDVTTVAPSKPRSGMSRYAAAGVLGVTEGFYDYYAGAWNPRSGGGGGGSLTDGDKTDIVVSVAGTVWTIDPSVLTAAGRALIDDASASDQRTTLGLGTLATQSGTFTDKADKTTTISTTAPLSGGGDLSANRTITTSMATGKLIGRGTAGTGVMEEITLGTNLSLTGTTLNATGGGGGATYGTTTIDFGTGKTDISAAISESGVTASSTVNAWIMPAATANNTPDNHWVEDLHIVAGSINDGVGFTVYASCKTGKAHGIYNIGWAYS